MSSYCVSIPTTTVDRPPRKPSPPELERGLVRVRVRHSKSKMLDRFRAVGVIEFEPDFVEQVLSTTSGDTYAHSPPPFDFNITILSTHPSIILSSLSTFLPRFPWITTSHWRHISQLASFLYLSRIRVECNDLSVAVSVSLPIQTHLGPDNVEL